MRWTNTRRRRIALAVAVLLPIGVLAQGLTQVEAQFPPKGGGIPQPPIGGGGIPKPPFGGGIPPPPFAPNGPGSKPPLGPGGLGGTKIVYDWRCSKCGKIIATTTTPFKPGVDSCPNCGVHFINGGKGFLTGPPNLPPNGGGPPVGGPPVGGPPVGGPPVGPPVGGPPADGGGFVPPPAPGGGAPNAAPPDFQPPPGPARPAAADVQANPPDHCRWCSAELEAGQSYCTGCKIKMGGISLGVTIVLGVMLVPLVLLGIVCYRAIGFSFLDSLPILGSAADLYKRK